MNWLQCSRLAPEPNRLTKFAFSCPSLHPTLLGFAARSSQQRQLALILHAAKGFGKTKKQSSSSKSSADGDRDGKARKAEKRARINPSDLGPIPGQNQPAQLVPQLQAPAELQPAVEEDEDFLSRLQALKAANKNREAAAATSASPSSDALAASPAIFDAVSPPGASDSNSNDNIYANPPPLAQTLLAAAGGGDAASTISDPKLRDAAIGPSQLGLAVGAMVFVAAFLVVAAGDYAPSSRRYAGVRPAQAPPDGIEEKILKSKVAMYEDQLKFDPNNDDATEALATSYAKLLQYDKAATLLEKLTKRNPDDVEAWRLLGESALLSQQPRKAVPAFERAVQLRRDKAAVVGTQPDLQLLTGMVDAYIANSEYGKAVETLRGVRQELAAARAASTAGAAAATSSSVAAMTVEEVAAAATPAMLTAPPVTDDDGTMAAVASSPATAVASAPAPADMSPSVSSEAQLSQPQPTPQQPPEQPTMPTVAAVRPLDPVGVELLTAKVFSVWRGHDQDALGTYDELIRAYPEDYRGYLAKGVFLKEKGRKADAERMFLQARFFAPASRQQLVRAIADTSPTLQLPDNN